MTERTFEDDPLKDQVRNMLAELGEDPERQGLLDTPKRVAKSMRFLLGGQDQNLTDVVNGALFEEEVDEMVLVHDIEFYSMCEHHMLPFFGRIHVAYLPKGRIIGLSKIPRIVDMFARRLQVQERLTVQVAEALQEVLEPKGVAVVSEASHLCMMMRGVSKQASRATASCMLGGFRKNAQTRNEFLSLVRASGNKY
ncbi:MAG: GTP cyclohydrolase I FolE [Planctomycetota bacterium]|nr:GTP cyclohydrolase I FolE [Planctomycetota bacterium]MDA1113538.1 GTP cyclohydrolase I FolE [Planctomycetota bacterium]